MKIYRIILTLSLVYMATGLKAQTITVGSINLNSNDLLVNCKIDSILLKSNIVLALNKPSAFVKTATYSGSSFPPAKMPNGYNKSADISVHMPTSKIYSSADALVEKMALPDGIQRGITIK
jgi:hypothetical protein